MTGASKAMISNRRPIGSLKDLAVGGTDRDDHEKAQLQRDHRQARQRGVKHLLAPAGRSRQEWRGPSPRTGRAR